MPREEAPQSIPIVNTNYSIVNFAAIRPTAQGVVDEGLAGMTIEVLPETGLFPGVLMTSRMLGPQVAVLYGPVRFEGTWSWFSVPTLNAVSGDDVHLSVAPKDSDGYAPGLVNEADMINGVNGAALTIVLTDEQGRVPYFPTLT